MPLASLPVCLSFWIHFPVWSLNSITNGSIFYLLATTRIRDDLFMTENYYQPRRNTPQFPQQNSYHNFCPVKVCNNFSRFWWQKKSIKKKPTDTTTSEKQRKMRFNIAFTAAPWEKNEKCIGCNTVGGCYKILYTYNAAAARNFVCCFCKFCMPA